MEKEYVTKSAEETKGLGVAVAKNILIEKKKRGGAAVINLIGELGAGKTQFAQGVAAGLGVKEMVNSPTFVVMRQYKIQDPKFKMLYHIDCYRMANKEDLRMLGLEEILPDPKNVVVVEWPQVAGDLLKGDLEVYLEAVKEGERKIKITAKG